MVGDEGQDAAAAFDAPLPKANEFYVVVLQPFGVAKEPSASTGLVAQYEKLMSSPSDRIRFSRTNPAPNESNEKQNPDTEQDRCQQDVNPSMIVNHQ